MTAHARGRAQDVESAFERRVQLLGQKMAAREALLDTLLAPRPFQERLTRKEALQWYWEHYGDDLYQQIVSNMTVQQRLDLESELRDWVLLEQQSSRPDTGIGDEESEEVF